ncbi:ABC transporter substrate-binding protein [Jiangella asiatica]|nr:ABC transporter substrate-binding protein [Jiangella asiatica]
MTRKYLTTLVGVCLLLTGACSSAEGGDGGDDTITYWSQWEKDEPQAAVLEDAIESFTAETGIEVEVEWQGRQVLQKVRPLLRSGDVPDLVDSSSSAIRATLVSADAARDLSAVFEAEVPGENATVGEVLGDYGSLITADSLDGPFMLPTITLAYSFFYDGASHPELAESPPQTWPDFMAMLQGLKVARGSGPVAVDGDIGAYLGVWTSNALINELGEGGFSELIADETGEAWRSPQVAAALEQIAQLPADDVWAEGSFGSKFPQIQERWAAGESDILLMGSWAPQETKNSTTGNFEYRQFAFPEGSAGQFTQSDVTGFAIPTDAEHPEQAEQFLAWLTRKDVMTALTQDALQLVTRMDLEAPPDIADTKRIMEETSVVRVYDGVDGDYPGYVTEVFEPINKQLMTGEITPETMVDQLVSAQADYWARQGQ